MKNNNRKVIEALCFLSALVFCALLFEAFYEKEKEEQNVRKLAEEVFPDLSAVFKTPELSGISEILQGSNADIHLLSEMNPDIIGWIMIPQTRINYPLLQHKTDNSYYLSHDFRKQESSAGSIFLYGEESADFMDSHMILFGHNMRLGHMFGELSEFVSEEYKNKHPFVFVFVPGKILKYEIGSAFYCSVYDRSYQLDVDTELLEYIRVNSVWNSEIDCSETNRLLTLSTCADGGETDKRFVLHCILSDEMRIRDSKQEE